ALMSVPEFEEVLKACVEDPNALDAWLDEADYQEAMRLWDEIIEHGEFIPFFEARQKQQSERSKAKMLDEMEESIHRENVNRRSIAISLINGISPFCCAVIPTIPYFLVRAGLLSMDVGYYLSASLAFLLMASFGGFLGRISKESVILYALKMIVVGTITAGLSLALGVGG
ncbi:MAG: VIT1/CCC1 transporter family protein, partial [Candidatus Bipolaricaulota bacterium]